MSGNCIKCGTYCCSCSGCILYEGKYCPSCAEKIIKEKQINTNTNASS